MSEMATPDVVVASAKELAFDPVFFSFADSGFAAPDVLVACLQDQPSMAPFDDAQGNPQSAVRLDLVDGTYWVSASQNATQDDIDAAVAAYPAKLAELHP